MTNESIARALYGELFNKRDYDTSVAHVTDDFVVVSIPTGTTLRGKEGYRQFLSTWGTAFPDSTVKVNRLIDNGENIAVEFTGKGTHSGPLVTPMGVIPPSGKPVETSFCDVLSFRGGKLATVRSYFDVASLLRQIGAA